LRPSFTGPITGTGQHHRPLERASLDRPFGVCHRPRVDLDIDPEFRSAVLERVCPVCGAGPFKMLASHTTQRHGLTAWQLRDQAGLRAHDSITSEELREQRSAHGRKMWDEHGHPEHPVGHKLRRTRAGNAEQRRKALEVFADPEVNERRKAGISRALSEKAASDPEYRASLGRISRRAAKARRQRFECVVCRRRFYRTPATKDRTTCSDQCATAAARKGLRIGWAAQRGAAA
jgi:hypothetical protein